MQVTLNIPDIHFVTYPKRDIALKMKLYAALMMYYAGEISAGAACEIADIDRFEFMEACKKYKIPIISYDIAEMTNEVEELLNL